MVQVDGWRVGHVVPCPLDWTSWAHRAHFWAIESETFVFRVRRFIPPRPKVIDQTLWACLLPWLHRAECQCPCLSSEHQVDGLGTIHFVENCTENEWHLNAYNSAIYQHTSMKFCSVVGLKMLYFKSFRSNSIKTVLWSQIHFHSRSNWKFFKRHLH